MYVRSLLAVLLILFSSSAVAKNYDPENITLGTTSGNLDFVKWMYFVVNGPPSGDTIGSDESTTGLVDLVETLLGSGGIGGILYSQGYTSCADIPSSADALTFGTYSFSYASGTRTIPSHFPTSGTMDTRITVANSGTDFLQAEFKCSGNDQTIYMRLSTDDNLDFEVYYHVNAAESESYMDFYWLNSDENTRAGIRFYTDDGSNFQMWISTSDPTENEYFSVAAVGSVGGDANLAIIGDSAGDDTTAVNTVADGFTVIDGNTNSYGTCANLTTEAACTYAAPSAPGSWQLGDGTTGDFNANDISSLTLSTL